MMCFQPIQNSSKITAKTLKKRIQEKNRKWTDLVESKKNENDDEKERVKRGTEMLSEKRWKAKSESGNAFGQEILVAEWDH